MDFDSAPYTPKQFQSIARCLLAIIKKSNVDGKPEEQGMKAKNLAIDIWFAARAIHPELNLPADNELDAWLGNYLEKANNPKNKKQLFAKLKKIQKDSHKLLKDITKEESAILTYYKIERDSLNRLISSLDDFVWDTKKQASEGFARGRKKNGDIEDFIKSVSITFKEASSLSFVEIQILPLQERRKWMGKYYSLLRHSMYDGKPFQSYEALEQYAKRYLKTNDPILEEDEL